VPFELQPVMCVRIQAHNPQNAGVHILVTGMTEQQTIGSGGRATVTPVSKMMQLSGVAPTRATAPVVALPHRGPHDLELRRLLRAAFALDDDMRFRFRYGARVAHRSPRVAAIVRSTQIRTPGITAAVFKARTTPPSFV
jgi:hypothetical protein